MQNPSKTETATTQQPLTAEALSSAQPIAPAPAVATDPTLPHTSDLSAPPATPDAEPAPLSAPPEIAVAEQNGDFSLNRLLNPELSTANLPVPVPSPALTQTALVNAKPVASVPATRKIRRNGRIAMLPKIQRDMVNRMLWNNVPYKNIVAALDDGGYTVTERNVSNWATRGGYLEWSAAQEFVLQNRLNQDHLVDFLRREDAPEIPEVGLQAAATRLSQVLLQKLAHADDPEANLGNFSTLIGLLCRLNHELASTQKQRDDSRRSLGKEYNPAFVKEDDEIGALETERFYSNPPSDAGLPQPPEPAAVPPMPTAAALAAEAHEQREEAKVQFHRQSLEMMKRLHAHCQNKPQPPAAPAPTQPLPPSTVDEAPALPKPETNPPSTILNLPVAPR